MLRKVAVLSVLLLSIANTTAFAAPLALAEEGNPWWLWLIIFAVFALFAGFMLWWWLHEPEEEEEPATMLPGQTGVYDAADMPEAAVDDGQVVAADTAPGDTGQILADSRAGQAETVDLGVAPAAPEREDLTIVEGIGPAIQKALYAAGIHTYQELAATDPGNLRAILQESDARLARLFDPATWPQQARLAALGQWEELDTLKRQLNAGRRE